MIALCFPREAVSQSESPQTSEATIERLLKFPSQPLSEEKLRKSANQDPDLWRITSRCGVNSLYCYLRLRKINIDYDRLLSGLPVHREGTTLQELADYSNHIGFSLTPVKTSPEKLKDLVPSILHREEKTGSTGHYVVLFHVAGDQVGYIDGTTGVVTQTNITRLSKEWSGYALVDSKKIRSPFINSGTLFAMLMGTIASLYAANSFSKSFRKRPTPEVSPEA